VHGTRLFSGKMLIDGKLVDALLVKKEEFANIVSLDTCNTIGPMRNDVTT
jgi:hypothetical protein